MTFMWSLASELSCMSNVQVEWFCETLAARQPRDSVGVCQVPAHCGTESGTEMASVGTVAESGTAMA
jgi:hypothetical protein